VLEKAMKKPFKSLVLEKSEYLGLDPKLFASQVGSVSIYQRKMESG
jgi:hypothetical protein